MNLTFSRITRDKNYELSNHLGNVLAVVSDRKITPNPQPKIAVKDIFDDPYNIGWTGVNGGYLELNRNKQLEIWLKGSSNPGAARDFLLIVTKPYS